MMTGSRKLRGGNASDPVVSWSERVAGCPDPLIMVVRDSLKVRWHWFHVLPFLFSPPAYDEQKRSELGVQLNAANESSTYMSKTKASAPLVLFESVGSQSFPYVNRRLASTMARQWLALFTVGRDE